MERVGSRGWTACARRVVWAGALAWLAVFVWLPLPAGAQEGGHTLQGTVMDATGGVLIGATVVLTSAEGIDTAETDERGQYAFAGLAPGDYALTFSHPGFQSVTMSRRIRGRATTTVDVALRVLVTSQVYVAPSGPGEGGTSSLFMRVLSGADLDELPSGRAFERRLRELAGATGRRGDVAIYVDGFRQAIKLPPREAIQMIRISSNPFAAEFAEPGHTRVEIITKPGFDRVAADLTFNYNDAALNARHPFAPERANVQMRNYEGYVSGPVVRNHWSLVLYGGRWEEDTSEVVNAMVLDPETLGPEPFASEIVTPSLIDNVWVGSNHQLGERHTLAAAFGHTRDEKRNQGLDGGLDLPERAYTRSEREDLVRLSLTSTLGPRAFNEFRVETKRSDSTTRALTDEGAVNVLDAFNAGGNQTQAFRQSREDAVFVSNQVTLARGRTTFKLGVGADVLRQRDTDATGFGGTFVFGSDVERDADGRPLPSGQGGAVDPLEVYRRTLLGVPGYGPSQYWVVQGDPRVGFSQWWGDWFAQGDWMPSSDLTVSYGVRQELQSHVAWSDGVSPRVGIAWSPGAGGGQTIRAGVGLFLDRIPARVTLDSVRLDGARQRRYTVRNPGFFPELPENGLSDAVLRSPTTQVVDPDMRTPRALMTSVTYDRRLTASLFASLGYQYERGAHQLRTRNVNAPIDGVLPWPDQGPILQYESTGRSERHELLVALRTDWTRTLTAFANYTFGSSRSDTDGPTMRPADSYDLASEFWWSNTHARHQGSAGLTLRLPGELIISSMAVMRAGLPFNITTGRDNNGDTIFTDRPAFADPSDPGAVVTPFGVFNPDPGPDDPVIPRNYGREPGEVRLDLHVQKAFRTGPGRTKIRLGGDVVNLLNRANRSRLNGVLSSAAFGTPRRALDPRKVELFLGVSF